MQGIGQKKQLKGFSKLNRSERIAVLNEWLGEEVTDELDSFLHKNPDCQKVFSEFSENYLTNHYLPFGVIPNVLVNGKMHLVPFVTEESSVVAAASRSARFWVDYGGFKAEILGTQKKGQVHFTWSGNTEFLYLHFQEIEKQLFSATDLLTAEMQKRGGGITKIELVDKSQLIEHYFQLDVSFETADAMGANFINTCLEKMAAVLENYLVQFSAHGRVEIIMSILSNYTPANLVKCTVECQVEELALMSGSYVPVDFVRRFELALKIAQKDISRAVTHNKGIYNGVDGVMLATGNDWRAVEADGHAYAVKEGTYQALSEVTVDEGVFSYSLTIPLAIGTVGGLTRNHPLVQFALKLMGNPSATELMAIAAAVGLANNFSAVTSLITSGIQKGHMKMHLSNMLNQLGATAEQKKEAMVYFSDKTVTYNGVKKFVNS